jgi:hypothetical protein
MPTVYEQVLGERYQELHPLLKAFHSSPQGAIADCRLDVVHPPGLLPLIFRLLIGAPAQGKAIETLLEVRANGNLEEWRRTFGRKTLVTRQWHHQGLLIESFGIAVYGLELAVVERGMQFRARRLWVLGVPFPVSLAPSIFAHVAPGEKSWRLIVSLKAPLLGPLLSYEGEVTPR